jgi:hypothetical protein
MQPAVGDNGSARDPATLEAGKINGCSLMLEINGNASDPATFDA